MLKKYLLLPSARIALAAMLISPLSLAAEPDTVDRDIDQASAPDSYVDPAIEVEAAFSQFFSYGLGSKLQQRMDDGELYVGKAWAEIPVDPQNSQWAKYRVMAYENAITSAENDYLMALSAKLAVEKVRSYYADNSGQIPEFDDSVNNGDKITRIVDKALTLTEGHLDKALNDLGLDSDEFRSAPAPQRHDLFKDALVKSAMKQAVGELSGLLPVQSFEAQNEAGEHVIGVVVVASPKMRQLAQEIQRRGGKIAPSPDNKGRSVTELISEDKNILLDQFGIRRIYDEQGYPVLVSYGQWGNAYHGENKRNARRQRAAALDQARSQADQQIAMFIAGKGMVTEESKVGQIVEEFVNVHKDGYQEEQSSMAIIDRLSKESRAKANLRLSGLMDVYTWTRPHPVYPEHEVVGVVRMWSPLNARNMKQLKDGQPHKKESAGTDSGAVNTTQQSKAYMQVDDF